VLLLCLLFCLMAREGGCRRPWRSFAAGVLAASIMAVRIVMLILVAPAACSFLLGLARGREGKRAALFFAAGLLLAYSPQIAYNWRAYHRPFADSYCRYWSQRAALYEDASRSQYGIGCGVLFHPRYFGSNVRTLRRHYAHFVALSMANLAVIVRRRRGDAALAMTDAFFAMSNCCALLYVGVILAYWWSPFSDCINRFLMPLTWVSLINLSHLVALTADSSAGGA